MAHTIFVIVYHNAYSQMSKEYYLVKKVEWELNWSPLVRLKMPEMKVAQIPSLVKNLEILL